jgi:hypothetical protein
LRKRKRSLLDHQQQTGHLQKGTPCKIKYKLRQLIEGRRVFAELIGAPETNARYIGKLTGQPLEPDSWQ